MNSARARRRSIFDVSGGVNLTPLLDIIFNLIFFFILATNIKEKQRFLDITLPASGTAERTVEDRRITEIAVTAEGEVLLDGETVTLEQLETRLSESAAKAKNNETMILYDAGITMQRFVDVTDVCRNAGILEPMLQLRQPEKGITP